ncbi:MAG TPA: DinB family protein [Pyrinomonadaceae bacterium]|nr:DinB family protein [Pyrinomonadaceae bacterium]
MEETTTQREKPPQSREEILAALKSLSGGGLDFWAALEPGRFAAPFGAAWSPADNLRHLIKSTEAVTKALKMPGLALRSLFGTADAPSLSYDALRDKYRGLLAGGADAGRFAPDAADAPEDAAAWQRELVGRCREAVSGLEKAAARWNESDLDRYLLPHPLLGKLTLREMLFFTLYHYTHHRENVVRRLAAHV